MKSSTLAIRDRKRLRQIAHHLHPVVTVGVVASVAVGVAEGTFREGRARGVLPSRPARPGPDPEGRRRVVDAAM